ncbi:MAG: hypothetical protein QG594_1099, partial [Bacteroidota bacterium]|nr:hypothetical protein [Bacteroidota bacterium]
MKISTQKSIAAHDSSNLNSFQKLGLTISFTGLFVLVLALFNVHFPNKSLWLSGTLLSILAGIVLYANQTYLTKPQGISNNNVWRQSLTHKGTLGWMLGVWLTIFYVVLYWFPAYLGLNIQGQNTGLVGFFDPLSLVLNGKPATQWFVYGT